MDWAQTNLPHLFPSAMADVQGAGFVYRGPYTTGNYIGVADGTVYVLGPSLSGNQLQAVGTLDALTCTVKPSHCTSGVAVKVAYAGGEWLTSIDRMPVSTGEFCDWAEGRGEPSVLNARTLADGILTTRYGSFSINECSFSAGVGHLRVSYPTLMGSLMGTMYANMSYTFPNAGQAPVTSGPNAVQLRADFDAADISLRIDQTIGSMPQPTSEMEFCGWAQSEGHPLSAPKLYAANGKTAVVASCSFYGNTGRVRVGIQTVRFGGYISSTPVYLSYTFPGATSMPQTGNHTATITGNGKTQSIASLPMPETEGQFCDWIGDFDAHNHPLSIEKLTGIWKYDVCRYYAGKGRVVIQQTNAFGLSGSVEYMYSFQ